MANWWENANTNQDPMSAYSTLPDMLGRAGTDTSTFTDVATPNQSSYFTDMFNQNNIPAGGGFLSGILGSKYTAPALGLLQSGLGFYQGQQQLGLAQDQLQTSKDQFNKQFGIQKSAMNREIYDQGKARYERNPTLNPTADEYFKQYKV